MQPATGLHDQRFFNSESIVAASSVSLLGASVIDEDLHNFLCDPRRWFA